MHSSSYSVNRHVTLDGMNEALRECAHETILFGESGIFGEKAEFCASLVKVLNEQADMQLDTSDPVASIGGVTKEEVLRAAFIGDITIETLAPSKSSDNTISFQEKLGARLSAIDAVTRIPDPMPEEEIKELATHRAKFYKRFTELSS